MRKIFVILLIISGFNVSLKAQIVIGRFNSDGNLYQSKLVSFKTGLIQKLSKCYYILENDLSQAEGQIAKNLHGEYYKKKVYPDFEPAIYLINCEISKSFKEIPNVYDFNFYILNIETNQIVPLSVKYLEEEQFDEAMELIAEYIKCTVPAYYRIVGYYGDDIVAINYGSDRAAESGDEFELVQLPGRTKAGELEIYDVNTSSSYCDVDLNQYGEEFSEFNYMSYLVVRPSDYDRREEIEEEITDLRADIDDVKEKLKQEEIDRWNNYNRRIYSPYVYATVGNFFFHDDVLKKYFNKQKHTPYIFGLEWRILGFITLKSRFSTLSYDIYKDEKFFFYQGGSGLNISMDLWNFLYPGFTVIGNYTEMQITKSSTNETYFYRGLGLESTVYCLMGFDRLGIGVEAGYQFYPILRGKMDNIVTSSFFFNFVLSYVIPWR